MFKKLLALAILLLFCNSVFGTVFLVEPVDAKVQSGEEIALGKAAKGETVRIVLKKKSELSVEWNSIAVGQLPQGWKSSSVETDKTLIALISIPANAVVSTQRIQFVLSNKSQPLFAESFFGNLSVRDNLLTVTIDNLNQQTIVGEKVRFRLIANNDSIAEHTVSIASDLPSYWLQPFSVKLNPSAATEIDLNVNAVAYGERRFNLIVSSTHNEKKFVFPASLSVNPTLKGKYTAALYGFPFFSPSLISNYLVNAFLALLS